MSILVNSSTRVITQGMTGKTGAFHTRACRAYANPDNFVAGVNPRKAGTEMDGIPIYGTVREAKEATGANVSVIYVPPVGAATAILEAVHAELDLVVCITEGIPVADMLNVRSIMRKMNSKTLLLGPNCPGLITPAEMKIGIMPGHICRKGRIGVVSRSGTLTYEAVAQLTALGLGQSTAVGIGGDPINGLKHVDVLKLFNEDPDTDAVVMIGEIGGSDEEIAARQNEQARRRVHRRHDRAGRQAHGPRRRDHLRRSGNGCREGPRAQRLRHPHDRQPGRNRTAARRRALTNPQSKDRAIFFPR